MKLLLFVTLRISLIIHSFNQQKTEFKRLQNLKDFQKIKF